MTDPREAVTDLFDGWAREGEADDAGRRHATTAGPVLDTIDLGAGTRLLDVGTGNGWAARRAADRGADVVGLDLSPSMLRTARSRGDGPAYVRGDVETLPFADGAFDVVFSMEAIYYAPDLDRALGEIRRVLGPDGEHHAVIDYYEENEASESWPDDCGVPMHRLSEAGWADRFREAGFVDVASERVRTDGDDWRATAGSLHVRGRVPSQTS